TVSAREFGKADSVDAIEMQVQSLLIDTSKGGIYAFNQSPDDLNLIQARVGGTNAAIQIESLGNINLGVVDAQGNDVSIHAHGAIEDARASNDTRANVQAKRLTLRGDQGVGTRTDMALDVSYLSASGGVGGVKAKNASAIEVDAASLENKGASGVTIVATHVTILDAQGNLIIMNGGNLYLEATDGNIVFLDQQDTIELQGGGSITLKARSESGRDGYKGAIITGNLTTQGGDITVDAESNATISRLDTGGTGDVWVESKHGLILDGNGVSENIRADKATLISSAPNFREAELTRDTAIAEYAAKVAEANAKKLTLDLMEQQQI